MVCNVIDALRSKDIEVTAEIANFHNSWSGEQQVPSCERGELLLIERLYGGEMLKGVSGCKGGGDEIVTLGQKARGIKFFLCRGGMWFENLKISVNKFF